MSTQQPASQLSAVTQLGLCIIAPLLLRTQLLRPACTTSILSHLLHLLNKPAMLQSCGVDATSGADTEQVLKPYLQHFLAALGMVVLRHTTSGLPSSHQSCLVE